MKQEFVLKYFRDIIKEKGCIKTTEIVVAITCFLLENEEDYISPLQILKLLPSDEIKTVEYQIADLPGKIKTLFYYKANSEIVTDVPKERGYGKCADSDWYHDSDHSDYVYNVKHNFET